jgi:hypothetical protein
MIDGQKEFVVTQRPSRHLYGLSFGQTSTGHVSNLESIQSPLEHLNGLLVGQPIWFGQLFLSA